MLALAISQVEFWLEISFMPLWLRAITLKIGLVMVVLGHYARVGAMFHAGESFHHIVQTKKADEHILITDGIYRYLRHPSYFGWSLWAIGTQVVLCNPICVCLYAYAAHMFFVDRIPHEEEHLVRFFGKKYIEYCERTPIRLPGIKTRFPCKN